MRHAGQRELRSEIVISQSGSQGGVGRYGLAGGAGELGPKAGGIGTRPVINGEKVESVRAGDEAVGA